MTSMLPKNLLPAYYLPLAYIAGGYAAMPRLATDIDVWVTQQPNLATTREVILNHLNHEGWTFEDLNVAWNEDYEGVTVQILKVALVKAEKPIHIMATNGNISVILANFDISTHQIAISPTGESIQGPQWTPLDVMPIVLLANIKTAERLVKITQRYEGFRKQV